MTRQQLLDLASLHRRRGRDAHRAFLVEGVRSVEAALAAGAPVLDILVADDASDDPRVSNLVMRASAPVSVVPARDVQRVAETRTAQGVVAVSRSVVSGGTEALRSVQSALVLDGVQDPGNVGALIRSAAWFGVEAVVMDTRSADPEGPKAVRASMGGLWDVHLVRVSEITEALDALSHLALWGADMGGTDASEWAPPAATALVMGSEAHGLSEAVSARLGGRVSISRGAEQRETPGVESLNVVVAAGVLMNRWRG